MIDHSAMKLGKAAAKFDSRTLRLAQYAYTSLPTPPDQSNWSNGIKDWGMMLNDQLGCCTIAAGAHAIQVFTSNTTGLVTVPDSAILDLYTQWDGYNPADPTTDQGGIELNVLNLWRTQGFSGHKLMAYADPAPQNQTHIKQSISLFGGVYIGLQLPISAQHQDVWDVVINDGGLWGGHAVFVCGYDKNGLTCITWGALKNMTWAFWDKYCDESHTLLSADWLQTIYQDQNGLNLEALQNDLKLITA